MEEQLLRLALMFATDRQTKTAWVEEADRKNEAR